MKGLHTKEGAWTSDKRAIRIIGCVQWKCVYEKGGTQDRPQLIIDCHHVGGIQPY